MSSFESAVVSVYRAITDMQWWENFKQLESSNELLIIFGGLVLIIGALKIVRSGMKMLFWFVLCGVGLVSVNYGLNNSTVQLPFNDSNELSEYVGTGKDLSADALELMCAKLEGL